MKFREYFNRRNRDVEDFVRKNVMTLEDFKLKLKTMDEDKIKYFHIMWKEADRKGYSNAEFFIKEIEKKLINEVI